MVFHLQLGSTEEVATAAEGEQWFILMMNSIHSIACIVFCRTLLSKSSPDADSIERNYVISVEEDRLIFDYLPDTLDLTGLPEGSQRYRTVIIDGLSLPVGLWHHIAVTVYAEDTAVYVNGRVEGVQALEGKMVDANRTLLLGMASDGKKCMFITIHIHVYTNYVTGIGSYSGSMEEMYLYTQALTERYRHYISTSSVH